ncbi:MAG: hypothetical protein HN377_15365, partial [Alphaproteobacteria bacterium]|nr:hypothetical protein [Alphaproteobacteria bacterium]
MLTLLRKHSQSFVVKIMAGLLVASFAVWGVEDMFTVISSNTSAIFEVGDIEGNPTAIENEVRGEINRLTPLFGSKFGV